jgi:hypothetical protein
MANFGTKINNKTPIEMQTMAATAVDEQRLKLNLLGTLGRGLTTRHPRDDELDGRPWRRSPSRCLLEGAPSGSSIELQLQVARMQWVFCSAIADPLIP